jgi:ribosomal protein S12 methylthiotransferase accessory factor
MRPETLDQTIRRMERDYPFFRLTRPVGGVVMSPVSIGNRDISVPEFTVFSANLGHLTMTCPSIAADGGGIVSYLGGGGSDEDPELALVRCVAESAERYANSIHGEDAHILASANELGRAALDLDTLPKCSATELADPKCAVRSAVKDQPIRWVKGVSLTNGGDAIYVPKVLTHLYIKPTEAEKFNYPISTGVAVHTSLAKALVSAICEVVERDAIALTWLARLPLPRIDIDCEIPVNYREKFRRLDRSLLKAYFFDATTDVGVPTAYSVLALDAHPHLARFVSCSTEFNMMDACAKIVRESAASRTAFEDKRPLPTDMRDFMALEDGAAYMALAENRAAFEFLTGSERRRGLTQIMTAHAQKDQMNDVDRLNWLIGRLKKLGMDVAAVDLTTDELRTVGLWAVRVVVPQLMPMSTSYRARFLAHPRLYEYARAAGLGALREQDINPYPQPFA